LNRLVLAFKKNKFFLLKAACFNLKYLFYRALGKKVIIYNLHYDYLFNTFEPILDELNKHNKYIVLFSYSQSQNLKTLLECRVKKSQLIESYISPFVYSDLFIASEVVGPDFPIRFFNIKNLQIYHGMGLNHIKKHKEILERFKYHFALGRHYKKELQNILGSSIEIFDVGFPKVDKLFSEQEYNKSKLKKVLYAPHWNLNSSLHYILKDFDMLLKLDLFIIIKPHNYLFKEFQDKEYHKLFLELTKKSPKIHYLTYSNTQELYKYADILLTDCYTTVVEEFTITKKPIVAFNSDEWFIENKKYSVEIEREFLESVFLVDTLDEAVNIIDAIFDNRVELKTNTQQKLLDKYFYNHSTASKEAFKAIENILSRKD
jgi:hypothetical protein